MPCNHGRSLAGLLEDLNLSLQSLHALPLMSA